MSWWRKTNLDDDGNIDGWIKIRSIRRKTNPGDSGSVDGWLRIKSGWRFQGGGLWYKIFGSESPYPKENPKLIFISTDSSTSETECTQRDKMYVTRGKWYEEPISFLIKIQKSIITNWDAPTTLISEELEYTTYQDSDYLDEVPKLASNRPTITLDDIKNKRGFRAQVAAGQDADPTVDDYLLATSWYPSSTGIFPRLNFGFTTYSTGDQIIEDETISVPDFKIFGFKWQYLTSSAASYPDGQYFPSSRTDEFIGKQIVELADFYGNRIGNLQDIDILPNHQYSASITYTQAMIDSGEDYIINLHSFAKDYYYDPALSLQGHIDGQDETVRVASYVFTPPREIEDPEITISNRTKTSVDIGWYSPDAERYKVELIDSITADSLGGYPKLSTEDVTASPFGLTENRLYTVSVTALAGENDKYKSERVSKSFRTLKTGIAAELGVPYDITSTGYKVNIENWSTISSFDITVSATSGAASRSSDVISVTNVPANSNSCLTAITSKIDNINLTAVSYDFAESSPVCIVIGGVWYCLNFVPGGGCSKSIEPYNKTSSGSGYSINCSQTDQCCPSVVLDPKVYTEWVVGLCTTPPQDPQRPRTRTWTQQQKTTAQNCVVTTVELSGSETEYIDCCVPSSTLGTKTYGTPNAWGTCNLNTGQIGRTIPWTATRTNFTRDCTTTTTPESGFDIEYKDCCSASTSTGPKTYGAWTAFGSCIQGERARSRSWTAIQTSNTINCTTTTQEVNGTEYEFTSCCTAGCTLGTKTYGAWTAFGSCIQGERARSRSWTAINTCINTSCNVTSASEVSGTEYEYTACCVQSCTTGEKTYGAWTAYGNCIQGERARSRGWTATQSCFTTSCTNTTETVSGTDYEFTGC